MTDSKLTEIMLTKDGRINKNDAVRKLFSVLQDNDQDDLFYALATLANLIKDEPFDISDKLEPYKKMILSSILKNIKEHGLDYMVGKVVNGLKNMGIIWPEIAIINKSIEHENTKNNKSINESNDLNTANEQVQIAAVKRDGTAIQYIKNPSESVQLAAVKQTGNAIWYIKNPSEQVQIAAAEQDGYAIRYIENPSESVQLAAVNKDGWIIQYIKNPSEQAQLAAVKQNGRAIRYIENPSEPVQLAAVKQNGRAIRLIENPSINVLNKCKHEIIKSILIYIKDSEFELASQLLQQAAKTNWPELAIIKRSLDHEKNKITESVEDEQAQIAAVKRDGTAIQFIKNPSEQVQLAAVNQSGWAIQYITNPSEQVKLAAVNKNGLAIEYIKNPSEQVQLAAVKRDGNAIQYFKNPSEPAQLEAVKRDGTAIQYIKNPSESVQLAAVNKYGWAIQYIKNPSEQVQLAIVQKYGRIIQFIENPSEAVQLAAVQENELAIQFIKNPSEAVQLAAVERNSNAIKVIKNPSISVLNQCKKQIIKVVLTRIRDGKIANFNDPLIQKLLPTGWPELQIIKRSLDHISQTTLTESKLKETAMNKTLRDYMPKSTVTESISEKPSINAQIEKLLAKEPKAKQTLILDALESLQKAGKPGISPQLWAASVKLLHPDPAFPIMDVLKTIAKTFTMCVKRDGPGLYVWDDSDRGIDDVTPETRAAVGNQVKLGYMVMRIMKRTGEFTIDEIAKLVAERTQMPAAQAAEYVKHIIEQYSGDTILNLGNGRYRINVEKPNTTDNQIDNLKRLAGLGPKD